MVVPNIILDSRRVEKYDLLMKELSRQGITEYKIWPCIIVKEVVSSINLSHKMIVQDAKDNGLEYVCVMEDDCMFPAEDGWEYFVSSIPEKFELHLSGTYILPITNRKIVGFHCYVLHESAYDRFLSVPHNVHIDTAMEDILDWTVCYPFAALQRKGFSANNMKEVDYNWVLSDCDIYGGLP
jgi:hypothetical protein